VLITGGAGFIGTNLAHRLASDGERVLIYDNLSRPGAERNLRWLLDNYGSRVQVEFADIRNPYALRRAVHHAKQVFHFAAQVAVTTSLANPRHDFDVNALGTLNLLEALRGSDDPAPLIYTSTNKVYGGLDDVALECEDGAYQPRDPKSDGLASTKRGRSISTVPMDVPRGPPMNTLSITRARLVCPPSSSV
jgi:CDP-paratose 2-epimerase